MVIAAMKLKDTYFLKGKLWPTLIALYEADISLPTKVHLVNAIVFPVFMYGYENWTIKETEHQRIDVLKCGAGEDSWESLGLPGNPTCPS